MPTYPPIPVPTDSVNKFIALGSLAVLVFSLWRIDVASNEAAQRAFALSERLAVQEVRKEGIDRRAKSSREIYQTKMELSNILMQPGDNQDLKGAIEIVESASNDRLASEVTAVGEEVARIRVTNKRLESDVDNMKLRMIAWGIMAGVSFLLCGFGFNRWLREQKVINEKTDLEVRLLRRQIEADAAPTTAASPTPPTPRAASAAAPDTPQHDDDHHAANRDASTSTSSPPPP